jgi:hypothetical protein
MKRQEVQPNMGDESAKHPYDGEPPPNSAARVERLRALPENGFYDSKLFERGGSEGAVNPPFMRLRLGNTHYPHMKLSLDLRPDGIGYIFRADAHDAHCCPGADSPEYGSFRDLMEKNQAIVQAIEADWTAAGVPTFKSYLQEDLDKRLNDTLGEDFGSDI